MKIYNKVEKVSNLPLINGKIDDSMKVLLAYLRKNYSTSLSNLNQNAIISLSQSESTESGTEVPISLSFKDGSSFRILLRNGAKGKTGRTGKTGPDGDKGDSPQLNNNYVSKLKGEIKDWLTIANDCLTDDSKKVVSALQGVKINEALELITETFLTEYQYALLFTDHVTIDAEFETFENNQLVQLIAEDKDSHKRYVKYWTFESDGEQEYFVFNYHTQSYDSIYADVWEDIYMGGKTGMFEATANQLLDGTQLYVKNEQEYPVINYEPIEQFNDTIYIYEGVNGDGEDVYTPSSLNTGEGPWFIKEYLKVNDEYIVNYREVDQEYIDKNKDKVYSQRDFVYYLRTANCYVDVNYNQSDGYDFNLHAKHLPENIYVFDHVEYKTDSDGNSIPLNIYRQISYSDVDPDSPIVYYMYNSDGEYETIENVKEYIKKKALRFYKYMNGEWNEVEHTYDEKGNLVVDINFDKYEEYITVEYVESSNTNTFRHYTHFKSLREEYYVENAGILNPYSIDYYVEYTDNEPRKFFTRRIVTTEDELGNQTFNYIYKEIVIPFWLEAEFVTEEEDQNVRLLSNNPEVNEDGDVEIIDPIYISSIEFENNEIIIAKNYNKDIKVSIFPSNANVTNMIMEYDDSLINLYEDGRIAALSNDEISKETIIKVYSEHDNSIGDELKIKIVTPIEKIKLNVDEINLYPGTSLKLIPSIEPAIVSNDKLSFTISDPDMLMIDNDNVVSPKSYIDEKGKKQYKTGTCTLTITADDGFGATLDIPVLVAVPITGIFIKSSDKAFVGKDFEIETNVTPTDATLVELNYESSNPEILEITESGIAKPKGEGEVTITCSSKDGSGVNAKQTISITTGVNQIKVNGFKDSIEVGLTNKFEIVVLPENATNKDIDIFVSDASTIEYTKPVLKSGTTNIYEMSITGKKGGLTQFVVGAVDGSGVVNDHDLTIPIPIEKISFEEPNIVIYEGDDLRVIKTIVTGPENVQNSQLEWYSSDDRIVRVDNYGRITPVKMGKAKISAISNDENKVIGTCNVTVKKHTDEIILNNGNTNTIKLLLNNFSFIPAEVKPYDASDQILRWHSSNELVCIVQENGNIYGKGLGEAIITASALDRSDISVSINVEVVKEITNKED